MSEANAPPEVPPESVRTPVVGSPRRCPVCQAVDLTGRQTVCSARCRPGAGRAASPGSGDPDTLGDGAEEAAGGAMNRRTFLSAATGGFLAAPFAAAAQQVDKVARVGFLDDVSPRN